MLSNSRQLIVALAHAIRSLEMGGDNAGYWEFLLNARLRMVNGNGFQDLFNDFMIRVHGDDFTPIRPHADQGDGGMDGALHNTVYQCYGAQNGHVIDAARVCRKMRGDFVRARATTPTMKEWLFAHNLVDGVSRPLHDALVEIKAIGAEHGISVGFFGLHGFRGLLRKMSDDDRTAVLGVRALDDMILARLPDQVKALISALIDEIRPIRDTYSNRAKVPQNKLIINNIPAHWSAQIEFFLRYSPIARRVMKKFGGEMDALVLPSFFRSKYESLQNEGMTPSQILSNMRAMLAGQVVDLVDDMRDFAAMTILADLFESCVIFEETRQEENQDVEYDFAN